MKEEARKVRKEIAKRQWSRMSEEERKLMREKIAAGMRKRWAERNEEERKLIGKNISKAKEEKASADKS